MSIKSQRLNSSAISAARYDTDTKTLSITFNNSGEYDFENVPESVYDGLVTAGSPGSYYHANIKGRF